jgi:hypothetical protein
MIRMEKIASFFAGAAFTALFFVSQIKDEKLKKLLRLLAVVVFIASLGLAFSLGRGFTDGFKAGYEFGR